MLSDYAAIAEIITSVAVIPSLIFIDLQVRDSSKTG